MTLRTTSKFRQWTVWLYALLVLLVVYVILSRLVNDSAWWDVLAPRQHRLLVLLLALFVYFARETRWDGVVRERKKARIRSEESRDAKRDLSASPPIGQPSGAATSSSLQQRDKSDAKRHVLSPAPNPTPTPNSNSVVADMSGEELYTKARGLHHLPIPDFAVDAEYLALLGKSAAKGYAPALAKLGEYAMRRAAWVEAYYWMTLARRNGLHGLLPTLREIRTRWARDMFPVQESNVNELFTEKSGSIGRALLCIDSGHGAAGAKEFLRTHYPDFLR